MSKLYEETRRKIQIVYGILKEELPKNELYPIKILNNAEEIFKDLAKDSGKKVSTIRKYFKTCLKERTGSLFRIDKKRITLNSIAGISGYPVRLSCKGLSDSNFAQIAFVILHEFGHNYCWKKKKKNTEFSADVYALKWIKKITKKYKSFTKSYLLNIQNKV